MLFASGYAAVRLLLGTSALITSSGSERPRVASLWVWTAAAAAIGSLSIVLTGVTATELDMSASRIAAVVVAVLVAAVVWRLYFGRDERVAQSVLAQADERRHLLARDAYTYLHIPIVDGLVLVAVARELVIAHPDDELTDAELLALASGPALFLLGSAAVVLRAFGRLSSPRLVATAGVIAAALLGTALPATDIGRARRAEAAPTP